MCRVYIALLASDASLADVVGFFFFFLHYIHLNTFFIYSKVIEFHFVTFMQLLIFLRLK